MSKGRFVAVVGSVGIRCETITRAFAAAGFETVAAPSITELEIPEDCESIELILDGSEVEGSAEALLDLKSRWPAAHVWGISETARLLGSWGDDVADAKPSAEFLSCEGILTRALQRLQPTGDEHLKLHEHMMYAKRELENIVDGSPDTIFVCSLDNRIVRGNRLFFEKVGKPPAEVLGSSCFEVLHGCSGEWPGCVQSQVLESGKPVHGGFDDLSIPGTYECTAFQVTLSGATQGVAHHLREIDAG